RRCTLPRRVWGSQVLKSVILAARLAVTRRGARTLLGFGRCCGLVWRPNHNSAAELGETGTTLRGNHSCFPGSFGASGALSFFRTESLGTSSVMGLPGAALNVATTVMSSVSCKPAGSLIWFLIGVGAGLGRGPRSAHRAEAPKATSEPATS